MNEKQKKFMAEAIKLAQENILAGNGGPFGAVIVKNGEIIAKGSNHVTTWNDPTAHAEVVAIREACASLGSFQLDGCEIYTSCEPCPMCLGAIYWARPDRIFYAAGKEDAARAGFDDAFIYHEIDLIPANRSIAAIQFMRDEANEVFNQWINSNIKIPY
ncbi:MAG: tRNA-specific adenosine deaminase [Bacteroidetes bacterium HGW-Bacteroidetes-9]|jgi:tRNA(Arg) A34 adenosine deaminase TadA|nr:MAG: tRNA-specific adenosine deaminase [Bacteroidetes bacterium HGW-Bacteroidetes-9]